MAVGFTWEEWGLLGPTQRILCGDVMLRNYSNSVSLGEAFLSPLHPCPVCVCFHVCIYPLPCPQQPTPRYVLALTCVPQLGRICRVDPTPYHQRETSPVPGAHTLPYWACWGLAGLWQQHQHFPPTF